MMTEWAVAPIKNHPGFAIGDKVRHRSGTNASGEDYGVWEAVVLGMCDCCHHLAISVPLDIMEHNDHFVGGTWHRAWTTNPTQLTNLSRGPNARHKIRIEGNELILEEP